MDTMVPDRGTSTDFSVLLQQFVQIGERIATALEASVAPEKPAPTISKEAMAIGLLFTMDRPTKTDIAERLGFSDNTGLRRMERFKFAWNCMQSGKTFLPGNHGPSGQRRNGREMSFEDDGTED